MAASARVSAAPATAKRCRFQVGVKLALLWAEAVDAASGARGGGRGWLQARVSLACTCQARVSNTQEFLSLYILLWCCIAAAHAPHFMSLTLSEWVICRHVTQLYCSVCLCFFAV